MIMILVYIILFILIYIFLSLAQIHLIGFTMSFYCKFHLIHVSLLFTVHYNCICSYCTYIMTSSISNRLHTLYGLTECKINEWMNIMGIPDFMRIVCNISLLTESHSFLKSLNSWCTVSFFPQVSNKCRNSTHQAICPYSKWS
jgi:hypothetical protein